LKTLVPALVVIGVIACTGAAVAAGLDATGVGILVAIIIVGAAAIAGTRKMGRVEPGRCEECGGLISPNAPYCKHCGARLQSGVRAARTGS
jgi:hypothetical protein